MDIKNVIETQVDNQSAMAVVSSTYKLLLLMKKHSVRVDDSFFAIYERHVLNRIKTKEKAEQYKPFIYNMFKMILAQVENKTIEIPEGFKAEASEPVSTKPSKTPNGDDALLTPEMLAELEKDLPPYVEPEPDPFFLEFKKMLNSEE